MLRVHLGKYSSDRPAAPEYTAVYTGGGDPAALGGGGASRGGGRGLGRARALVRGGPRERSAAGRGRGANCSG